MEFLNPIMEALNKEMTVPTLFGTFHVVSLVLSFVIAVALSIWQNKCKKEHQRTVLLITTIIVIILEIYKQFLFAYRASWEYQWYAFPMQFCSTPMYVGLLAALTKKGKIHESACSYMVSFSLFAGLAVMIYPASVFMPPIGINIQTMVCHGSMIFLAIYLMATGYVKIGFKTVLKALPLFVIFLCIAMGINELAHLSNPETAFGMNMFYISPYMACELPILNTIQTMVPHWVFLLIYALGFVVVAYVMQLLAMLVRWIGGLFTKKTPAEQSV